MLLHPCIVTFHMLCSPCVAALNWLFCLCVAKLKMLLCFLLLHWQFCYVYMCYLDYVAVYVRRRQIWNSSVQMLGPQSVSTGQGKTENITQKNKNPSNHLLWNPRLLPFVQFLEHWYLHTDIYIFPFHTNIWIRNKHVYISKDRQAYIITCLQKCT